MTKGSRSARFEVATTPARMSCSPASLGGAMSDLDELAAAAAHSASPGAKRANATSSRGSGGASWMILAGGEESGPYPEDELRALWNSGALGADAKVWREGMSDWVPIDSEWAVGSMPRPTLSPASSSPSVSTVAYASQATGR